MNVKILNGPIGADTLKGTIEVILHCQQLVQPGVGVLQALVGADRRPVDLVLRKNFFLFNGIKFSLDDCLKLPSPALMNSVENVT